MLYVLDKSVILWLIISIAHAWWDAWFGIELFNESNVTFKGQHFLGGLLSPMWFVLFLIIFDFNLSLENFGWLFVGLSIAGGGCNLLRYIHYRITGLKLINSDKIEWWFMLFVTRKQMKIINLLLLLIGIIFIFASITVNI